VARPPAVFRSGQRSVQQELAPFLVDPARQYPSASAGALRIAECVMNLMPQVVAVRGSDGRNTPAAKTRRPGCATRFESRAVLVFQV
jgi:hypothetical protein